MKKLYSSLIFAVSAALLALVLTSVATAADYGPNKNSPTSYTIIHPKGYVCTLSTNNDSSYDLFCEISSVSEWNGSPLPLPLAGEWHDEWVGQMHSSQDFTSNTVGVHKQNDSWYFISTGKANNHKRPYWSTYAVLVPFSFIDKDGDGHNNETDINDTNPNVWQYLNGYIDNDKDGFGVGELIINIPSNDTLPPGYVANLSNGIDCNDSNPLVHPNAVEIQNGIDNNCNGQIDEGFTDTLPPIIRLIHPQSGSIFDILKLIKFIFTVNDASEISSCSINISGNLHPVSNISKITENTLDLNLSAGNYSANIICKDSLNNTGITPLIYFKIIANQTDGNNTNITDTTPPSPVTDLHLFAKSYSYITWKWINPSDADFSESLIYIDNIFITAINSDTFTWSNLKSNTEYTIKIYTKDSNGNINSNGVIDSQKTNKKSSTASSSSDTNYIPLDSTIDASVQNLAQNKYDNAQNDTQISISKVSSGSINYSLILFVFSLLVLILLLAILITILRS